MSIVSVEWSCTASVWSDLWRWPWKATTVGPGPWISKFSWLAFKEIFPAPAKNDHIDTDKMLELFQLGDTLARAKNVIQEVKPVPERKPTAETIDTTAPAASNVATQPSRQQSGLLFHFPQQ